MGLLRLVRTVLTLPMRFVKRRDVSSAPGASGSPSAEDRWLVVGLGNPGSRFARTRHNAGFDVVDRLASSLGVSLADGPKRFRAKIGAGHAGPNRVPVILAKPQTYMNLSGESVRTICRHYRIPSARLLVVYDDLDTPVGAIKLKGKGGHGGHNGVRNIIDEVPGCEAKVFPRLKIGVGRPRDDVPVYDHVLTRFDATERETLETVTFAEAVDAIEQCLTNGLDRAMTAVNTKRPADGTGTGTGKGPGKGKGKAGGGDTTDAASKGNDAARTNEAANASSRVADAVRGGAAGEEEAAARAAREVVEAAVKAVVAASTAESPEGNR